MMHWSDALGLLGVMALFDLWGGGFWFRWWRSGVPAGRVQYEVPLGVMLPNSWRLSFYPGRLALRTLAPDLVLFREPTPLLLPLAPVHGELVLKGRVLTASLHFGWTATAVYVVLLVLCFQWAMAPLLLVAVALKDWWWYRRVIRDIDGLVAYCLEHAEGGLRPPGSVSRRP